MNQTKIRLIPSAASERIDKHRFSINMTFYLDNLKAEARKPAKSAIDDEFGSICDYSNNNNE
jgi:hypothetical protein